jgi:hypothetical protein
MNALGRSSQRKVQNKGRLFGSEAVAKQRRLDMDSAIVTKRFHISGLTPALSQAAMSDRLSSFATVKAFDGLGLSNGLDERRNFAFVTLEGTTSNLSRCE